jgi:hypothetical protein
MSPRLVEYFLRPWTAPLKLASDLSLWVGGETEHSQSPITDHGPMSIPFLACMAAAAAFYHLPPRVLPSIQAVEGGAPGLVQPAVNGTADLGLMQVNTIWIGPLARYAGMPEAIVRVRLIEDACFNIAASAAIMRLYLTEAGGDLMTAIGYYHSHTPRFGAAYQQKVLAAAAGLFGQPSSRRQ